MAKDGIFAIMDEKQKQEELQKIVEEMVRAFNEFHEHMSALQKRQRNITQHIRQRLDQKKIDEVRKTLENIQEHIQNDNS